MIALFVLSLLIVVNPTPVSANDVANCPDGFHLHDWSEHHHQHGGDGGHHHVGNDEDLNGDGYICGKHVGKDGNVHVHIDNNFPLDKSE